jgi:hypothetical protein
MVEPGLRASNRTLLLRNMFWDPAAGLENNGAGLEQMIAGKLFFWLARVCWPLLCLCRPFCIVERCLDSNPESCRSKQARYQLSHPSPYQSPISLFSHPSPSKTTHLPLPVNFYNRTKLLYSFPAFNFL